MIDEKTIQSNVPLAPLTTLQLGGPARWFVEADHESTIIDALRWANERSVRVAIVGGGSNLVVRDDGFDGLVVHVATRGIAVEREGDRVRVTVAAGESWDAFVHHAVDEQWAGVECLAGIPGTVGATPIQNVGAYGQEVSQTIERVRVLDRRTLSVRTWSASECEFAYRDSVFKTSRGADAVVLDVTFVFAQTGLPSLRYAELSKALAVVNGSPSLQQVRDTVVALRRSKSMVVDPRDENHRSAGSFFTNPIVPSAQADDVAARAVALGVLDRADAMPRFAADHGMVKLAAGWLIERAGFHKGLREGAVGISSKHALALVHHGGGTTAQLLALAETIRAGVRARFGVELLQEPVLL